MNNTATYSVLDRITGALIRTYGVNRYAFNKARELNSRTASSRYTVVIERDSVRSEWSANRMLRAC